MAGMEQPRNRVIDPADSNDTLSRLKSERYANQVAPVQAAPQVITAQQLAESRRSGDAEWGREDAKLPKR